MSKKKTKKTKKDEIYLEDEVRAFAVKRQVDEENVLNLWKEVLEDKDLNKMKNKSERDEERVKLLKLKLTEQVAAVRPIKEIEGVMLGIGSEKTWNVDEIKKLLEAYEKDPDSVIVNKRPLVVKGKDGQPMTIAYSKMGNPYPFVVRKERTVHFYGGPEEMEPELVTFNIGGTVKQDGEEHYIVHLIDKYPRGMRVKMLVQISENFINIAKKPINDNGYFEIIDEEVDFDELFEEDNLSNDFVEFAEIDDYVRDAPKVPFWSEATVVSIGEKGDYDSYIITIMDKPSGSFDDDEDYKTIYVPDDIPVNYAIKDKIRFVCNGYIKKEDSSIGLNVTGIYPYVPIVESASKKLVEKAKGKGKSKKNKIDLFD